MHIVSFSLESQRIYKYISYVIVTNHHGVRKSCFLKHKIKKNKTKKDHFCRTLPNNKNVTRGKNKSRFSALTWLRLK